MADPGPVPSETLEIGVGEYGSSALSPLADGDPVAIVLGPEALLLLPLALRVRDATPAESDPTITVTAMGTFVAGTHKHHFPWTRESDSPGTWVLAPRAVVQDVDYCCVACRDALVEASVETEYGGLLRASVRVLLTYRTYCPEAPPCCRSADDCPDPAMARLCEPAPGG